MQEIHKIMIVMQTKYQVPFDTQANVTIRLISNSLTTLINSLRHCGGGDGAAKQSIISQVSKV